jgi:hypothetical protein
VQGVRIGDRILLLVIGLSGTAAWTETDDGGELSFVPSIRILERKVIAAGSSPLERFDEEILRPLIDRGEAILEHDGLTIVRATTQTLVDGSAAGTPPDALADGA